MRLKTSASQANKKIPGNGAELNERDITPIAKVFKVDTNGMENKMAWLEKGLIAWSAAGSVGDKLSNLRRESNTEVTTDHDLRKKVPSLHIGNWISLI